MPCCSALNCNNRSENSRMFRFPRDPERKAKWVQNTGRSNWTMTINSSLCEIHFEDSQFEQNRKDGWRKLKPNAIPTLFNIPDPSPMINLPPRESVYKRYKKKINSIKMTGCCAVNCKNRSNNFRLFTFPANPERRAKWVQNMHRENWTPTIGSRLCEVHFEDSQFENNRQDGWKKLTPNAVPTLFHVPNPPQLINPRTRTSVYKETVTGKKQKLTLQNKRSMRRRCPPTPSTNIEEVNPPIYVLQEQEMEEGNEDISEEEELESPVAIFIKQEMEYEEEEEEEEEIMLPVDDLVKQEMWSEEEEEEEEEEEDRKEEEPVDHGTEASTSQGLVIQEQEMCESSTIPGDKNSSSRGGRTSISEISRKAEVKRGNKVGHEDKGSERGFLCYVCKMPFLTNSSLKIHERTHIRKLYECFDCKKVLSSKQSHFNHMRTHTGEKLYSCGVCNKKFSWRQTMREHLQSHSGVSHECILCDKRFVHKASLAFHVRLHVAQKPYCCIFCNKRFAETVSVAEHMKLHSSTRTYECNVCKKCFHDEHILSHHMKSHSDEVQESTPLTTTYTEQNGGRKEYILKRTL